MNHPLSEMMSNSMSKIKDMIDVNTVIGSPITTPDGVTLIRNAEELTSAVNVSVLSAEKPAEKSWRIFLAFRNQRDFPVRLTSLTRKQNVLLQDAEGFVYELAAGENAQRVITIPAQAAVKVPFDFVRVDAVPRSIRLYGKDIPFPDGL